MMWVIFARAPPPDVQVWPGRRLLALADAVAWPAAWAVWLLGLSVPLGLAGQFALAWCGVAAARRSFRAVLQNHRYHFTTWRWGRWLAFVLLFGYPSFQKYDESRQQPYSAFTDRLSRFLEQDDAMLVVAGFSFGDEHINNLIFGALENRPRTHVYALQFGELGPEADLMKRAAQRPNMIVISPKTGTIGGRQSLWAPVECPPFMDAVFELQEATPDGGIPMKSGRMKIGDFACFCDFLESMTTA